MNSQPRNQAAIPPPGEPGGTLAAIPVGDTPLLVGGPYEPTCKVGDVLFCLHRDYEVRVIGLSEGRIPWPIGVRNERPRKSGLVVEEALARAIRTESALALVYHWGVGKTTASSWRRAVLGEAGGHGRAHPTPGTTARKAAAGLAQVHTLHTPEAVARSTFSRGGWTPEDDAILLTSADAHSAAAILGRTAGACYARRVRLTKESWIWRIKEN